MTPVDEGRAEPKVNILLVDDQPANLLALEAILAHPGLNLVKAQSGNEALRLLLDKEFAVILLDVQMHGLDGFETARLIRGRRRSRPTPIIFLTVYESVDFPVVEAYKLGAVDYLLKPLVPEILRAKVAGFVELFQKTEQVKRQADQLRQLERREFERQSLAERARLAALRADISGALARSDSERQVLQLCAEALVRHLDAALARIWTLNPKDQVLELQASAGLYTHLDDAHSRVPLGQFRVGLVAQQRQSLLTNAVADDPRFGDLDWARQEGLVSFAGYPLMVEDRVVGVVALFGRQPLADNTLHALASAADSTAQCVERKRAEVALRISRERLDLVIATSGVGLWYCDLPFDQLDWNDRCKEHFGLPADAAVTIELFYERLHPDDRARTRQAIERSLADHANFDTIYRTVGPDGQLRWIRALGRGIYDRSGRPLRFDGITVDVTNQKRTEEALREADRRKDEFLAMLAHELRNPLAPVLTSLHVLRLVGADGRAAEEARAMIERQIQHLKTLVDDLLDVSRITRGKVLVRRERLDFAQRVRTTAEDYRRTLEQAGLQLTLEAPATPVWVLGDDTRLAQVLTNLLDNAVKFSNGAGEVIVRVTADAEQGRAILSVRDTGMGIEPDMLSRLFDAFAQADRSLERTRGGLGLGLALVKGLVELHGGDVEAASAGPDRGAEFILRLPLEREPAALSTLPTSLRTDGTRLRIVVIEDSRDAAESLRLLLGLLGHEVAVARSGPEGVELARANRPDVVLCDIGLPGLDGYGVAAALRHDPATARARLIALTGYGQAEDRRRSHEAGFDHHLTKPLNPDALQPLLARREAAAT